LRSLKHHLIEQQRQQQTSHSTEWQTTQQQQQQEEKGIIGENDDQRLSLSSLNHQITAIEHCTVAMETLLLQDKLPAMVSSLTQFQEWLLKPFEEVYKDPYEHLCTDDDEHSFDED